LGSCRKTEMLRLDKWVQTLRQNVS
jgi:hypothetical protein